LGKAGAEETTGKQHQKFRIALSMIEDAEGRYSAKDSIIVGGQPQQYRRGFTAM